MDRDKLNCLKCNSDRIKRVSELSGWAFFIECKDCNEKFFYSVNDQMGCEGCNPYHLIWQKKEWNEEYFINELASLLEEAENGWENKNGISYSKYDRLIHTAKNLINKINIK